MSDRLFPNFTDTMEWNLVARATYQAPQTPTPYLNRLPSRSFLIENSHVLIIGLKSNSARSYWVTGGWAAQFFPFLPSSTSEYPAIVQGKRRWLRLGVMSLVIFPKILSTWVLELQFPYWLNDISIEVWRYDGTDLTVFDRIDTLEQQL